MLRPTAITCIHICNQWCAMRIKICDHVGVSTHIAELCESKVGLAETRGRCACTCLVDVSKLVQAFHKWMLLTMYNASKPTERAIRAENPS